MCPDWESNPKGIEPSGSQASTQSTEPHQPGQYKVILKHSSAYIIQEQSNYYFMWLSMKEETKVKYYFELESLNW